LPLLQGNFQGTFIGPFHTLRTAPSLEVEQVITDCIDHIDRAVRAAQSYSAESGDLFAPGADEQETPPNERPRAWRR
jgi:hypothetical protein